MTERYDQIRYDGRQDRIEFEREVYAAAGITTTTNPEDTMANDARMMSELAFCRTWKSYFWSLKKCREFWAWQNSPCHSHNPACVKI